MWSTTTLHANDSTLDIPASEKVATRNHANALLDDSYDEEDDTATTASTGATLSTMMDQDFTMDTSQPLCLQDTSRPTSRSAFIAAFEASMLEKTRTTAASLPSRNTYFLDGGNRFISLPLVGNTNTKTAAHVSRMFEEWLQNKLYHPQDSQEMRMMMDRLPILEDSVDLLAEDILNKLKSRSCVRGLTGVAKIMIKVRTGHVYCFDQLIQQEEIDNNGDGPHQLPHLITPDMMDFFQQFPLFLDTTIYLEPKSNPHHGSPLDMDDSIPVLLSIENISTNPSDPYYLFENISLIV